MHPWKWNSFDDFFILYSESWESIFHPERECIEDKNNEKMPFVGWRSNYGGKVVSPYRSYPIDEVTEFSRQFWLNMKLLVGTQSMFFVLDILILFLAILAIIILIIFHSSTILRWLLFTQNSPSFSRWPHFGPPKDGNEGDFYTFSGKIYDLPGCLRATKPHVRELMVKRISVLYCFYGH